MAKSYKMAKCVFYGQRGLKMAKFFEIDHKMANLATLSTCEVKWQVPIEIVPAQYFESSV